MEILFTIDGTGQIVNRGRMGDFFRAHQPGSYLLTSKPKNLRSNPQNAYYWAVMIPAVFDGLREMGYDEIRLPEHAHEVIKGLFLTKTIGGNDQNKPISMAGSTTELTTIQFSELIADVQKWAIEFLNINIPSPGERLEIDYPTETLPEY